MNEHDTINEKSDVKRKKKLGRKAVEWKSIFSGSILQSDFLYKQRWYILLLFVLSVFYISNRYKAEKTLRYSAKLKIEVTDKKAEYVTKSSELMRLSKRSEVLKLIQRRNLDLKESKIPPKRVKND